VTLVLGIDVGTHESKGVLVTTEGQIVAKASIAHATATPTRGWAEHDADDVWWHDFVALCRRLLGDGAVSPADVGAVGCSAIGPCVLPVDSAGRPLRPGILYGIDTRASLETSELTEQLGADWIIRETGASLSAQAAGPKILWLRRHEPAIWAKTSRIMTSTSYLVFRLTGRVVIDHYTAAAYGPLYNLHRRAWDPRALELVCSQDLLPEIDWSAAVAGPVSAAAAQATGLRQGTPVIVGTADAAAEATAAGVRNPGDIMVMYGSSGFFIAISDALVPSPVLWSTTYLDSRTYAMAAGMSTTGSLLTWFRDTLGPSSSDHASPDAFDVLADEARQVPAGAGGLLTLPYFSGERSPINDPRARGAVFGLTLAHTRGHVYRSMMEGIGFGVRHNLEAMEAAGVAMRRVVAIGGGTANDLWVQTVSDVTGRAQQVQHMPGAALGGAMLAAAGAGLVRDLEATREWIPAGRIVRPNDAVRAVYEERYALYRALYEETAPIAHALAEADTEPTNDAANQGGDTHDLDV